MRAVQEEETYNAHRMYETNFSIYPTTIFAFYWVQKKTKQFPGAKPIERMQCRDTQFVYRYGIKIMSSKNKTYQN